MASIHEEIQQLKDQISLLVWESKKQGKKYDEAVKETQERLTESEKRLEKAEQKLVQSEKSLAEIQTKLSQTEKTLNEERKKHKKTITEIDAKVRTNTEDLKTAKGLQILFKNSLVGKAERRIESGDIANVESRISCLSNTFEDLKVQVTRNTSHLSQISIYNFSVCEKVDVDQGKGILTCVDDRPARFISARPLTQECHSFSVRILDSPSGVWVDIGVAPRDWDVRRVLGYEEGTVGYSSIFGKILVSGKGVHDSRNAKCFQGDVLKVALTFSPLRIELFKNDTLIHREKLGKPFQPGSLYAAVQLYSKGSKVKLMETGPWRA